MLKRGVSVHRGTEADLGYFWAAYRKDGMDPERFPRGLSQDQFLGRLERQIGSAARVDIIVGRYAKGDGFRPVGAVVVATDGYHVFPVVTWFPWASDRNRLEGAAYWLNEVRRSHLAVFKVTMLERGFFDRLCQYALLHRVGVLPDWYGAGSGAMEYCTRLVRA